MKRDFQTGTGNPDTYCYVYLHVNGKLISVPAMGYNTEDLEESDFVRCWWKINFHDRADAYKMLIRARTLGVNNQSFNELMRAWEINDLDCEEYIRREGLNFRKDDTGNWMVYANQEYAGRNRSLFLALCEFYDLSVVCEK